MPNGKGNNKRTLHDGAARRHLDRDSDGSTLSDFVPEDGDLIHADDAEIVEQSDVRVEPELSGWKRFLAGLASIGQSMARSRIGQGLAWLGSLIFMPHTLLRSTVPKLAEVVIGNEGMFVVAEPPSRLKQFLVRSLNMLIWGGLACLFALYVFQAETVTSILSLLSLDKLFSLESTLPRALLVSAMGMVSAGFGQLLVTAFKARKPIALYLYFLLFDPGMLAGLKAEDDKNSDTLRWLYTKAVFTRLLNIVVWGGILFALGLVPIVSNAFSGISWLGSFTGPAILGIVGAGCALLGQGLGFVTRQKQESLDKDVSRLSTFIYGLLVEPARYFRKLMPGFAEMIATRDGYTRMIGIAAVAVLLIGLYAAIWGGLAALVTSALPLPQAWLDILGAGMFEKVIVPLVGCMVFLAATAYQVFIYKFRSGENDQQTLDSDVEQQNAKAPSSGSYGRNFMQRAWQEETLPNPPNLLTAFEVRGSDDEEDDAGKELQTGWRVGFMGPRPAVEKEPMAAMESPYGYNKPPQSSSF